MILKTSLAAGLLAAFAIPSVALADAAISNPFARATPPNAKTGAAYAAIASVEGDRLLAVASPAAEMGQIHDMKIEDGVAKMREIEGGLEIPAGQTVSLAPGGKHLMLMGLTGPLVEGSDITLILTFEKAGEVEVTAPVKKVMAGHGKEDEKAQDHGHTTHNQ